MTEQMEILWLHNELNKVKNELELTQIKRDYYQKESQEAHKLIQHYGEKNGLLIERIAELEAALREIDSDPSQVVLTDAHRKLLEKGGK